MPSKLRYAAAICLAWSGVGGQLVAQTPDSAAAPQVGARSKSGKGPHRAVKPAAKPTSLSAGPAANLNAPSMDFNGVEAETGEPRQRRQQGPNVRPTVDSSGRPVMGVGF